MAVRRACLTLVISGACPTLVGAKRSSVNAAALAHNEAQPRVASSAQAGSDGLDSPGDKYSGLLLGTMNVIGNDENPFQFYPSTADMKLALGDQGEEKWKAAYAGALSAFEKYTIAQAMETVAQALEAREALKKGRVAPTLRTFVDSLPTGAEERSVLSLIKDSTLDLNLDNKWVEDMRINPIVQAMGPQPGTSPAVPKMLAVTQSQSIAEARILSYYATRIDKAPAKEWGSLLLWDLLCTYVAKQAPEHLATLAKVSYMNNAKDLLGAKPDIVSDLFAPLKKLVGQHPKATVIVGGQEVPKEWSFGDVVASAGLSVFYKPAQMASEKDSTVTGFFHSKDLTVVDATARIEKDLEAKLVQLKVKEDVIKTTLRKMLVAEFKVGEKPYATVIVFHSKSFKKQVAAQAAFVATAMALAKTSDSGPVYAVGDMNIDAKFPKGTTVEAAKEAVMKAEFGMMPAECGDLVETFAKELAGQQVQPYPEAARTLTTLKMRTALQGQPGKADEVTVAHKDFVFVPTGTKVSRVVVGGRAEEGAAGNLGLLQPSRFWPSDHFAIMAFVAIYSGAPWKAIFRQSARAFP